MLSETDRHDLRYAKTLLENPSLASRLTALLGASLERGIELLPDNWAHGLKILVLPPM